MVGGTGLLLIAAIGGYWVLERSATHKGGLRRVGQWLGGLVIVASLVGVVCKIWCASAMCPAGTAKRSWCPWSKPSGGMRAPSMSMGEGIEER